MCPARLDREEEYFVRRHFCNSREKSLDELCRDFYSAACSFLEQEGNVTRALGRMIREGYLYENTDLDKIFRKLFGLASNYATGVEMTPNQHLEIKGIARKRNNVTKKGINEIRVEKGAKRAQRNHLGDFSGPR